MTRTDLDYRSTRPPINIMGELKEGYELVEESTWRGKKYYIQRRESNFPYFILVLLIALIMWLFSTNDKVEPASNAKEAPKTALRR